MIETRRLYFSYDQRPPWVLADINFIAVKGDFVSIVGDNGSGKSTFIRLLLGFLSPTRGEVCVATHAIGYVPQLRDAGSTLGFPLSLEESLMSYRRLLSVPRRAVDEVLDAVGLRGVKSRLIGQLSGGQQQKAQIARALLGNPDLLILDEPTTGIDAMSQRDIYALLSRLNRTQKTTILSIEHNLDAAVANATTIFHLVDGHGHPCSPERFQREFLP